jgi:NAD(P)-dependent dehydrogenase (short-subunit alcohol dehydrogenase family)
MRHAVVTGTSSGIGAAIAENLLAGGWRVTGLDRAPAVNNAPAFKSIEVDLLDRAGTLSAAGSLEEVSAFVHAAGIMRGGPLGMLDHDAGEVLWRLHVDAAVVLANHFAPQLPRGGRIVLIGSRAARGVIGKSQYGAAKAALVGLAKGWAKELAGAGVTVNVVAPAATDTAMLVDPGRAVLPPETPPIGRLIRPQEIAALVGFLLSENAAAITGQEIAICGGASL